MPSESPGLRPLTIGERGFTTIYGSIPSAFVQLFLRGLFGILSGPDLSWWQLLLYATGFESFAGLNIRIWIVDEVGLSHILAAGMYALFYFNWGRSLGHMAVRANIVDAKTGRRMRNWQKAVRSALHIIVAYPLFWAILQLLSVALVLLDRERRRSLYDLAAHTVVVVGEPVEEEPETVRERSWVDALFGRLSGRESSG